MPSKISSEVLDSKEVLRFLRVLITNTESWSKGKRSVIPLGGFPPLVASTGCRRDVTMRLI